MARGRPVHSKPEMRKPTAHPQPSIAVNPAPTAASDDRYLGLQQLVILTEIQPASVRAVCYQLWKAAQTLADAP